MRTGTADTRARAAQAWTPVLTQAGSAGQELGEELLAVAHQIAVHRLSGPLTDPGRAPQDKADLARDLFDGRADARVVELLQGLVRGRWSRPVDLLTALHDLGIETILQGARAGGTLDQVEQELFDVTDVLAGNEELSTALEPSRRVTTEDRVALALRVFGPHLSLAALSLLTWCVRHRVEGGVTRNLRRVTELAAAMQHRVIADVVTAIPMTRAQEARLRAILAERLASEIELNASVDPAVAGGVRISVRDLVIDSTVSTSIHQLRNALTL